MIGERPLIACFLEIESKHSGLSAADADGDRTRARIVERRQELANAPDIQEFQCPVRNDWDAGVLHALLARYGIKPYRYRGMRKSTILVSISKRFMDEYLWPIFLDLVKELDARFALLTTALLPAIAPGPYPLAVLDHEHRAGELCENCRKRLLEQLS